MLRLEAPGRRAWATSYSAFCTSTIDCGNMVMLPMWSGWVWDTATNLMSDGLTFSSASWLASVFGRFQCIARGSAGRCPSGMAAIASVSPVSQSSQP